MAETIKSKSRMKKTLKYAGIIFLSLFFLLLLAPFLFKKQIVSKIKSIANEQLTATLDFDNDISLSFIRNFPNASLGIKDLSIVGRGLSRETPLLHPNIFGWLSI